jgi:hypothetical protein
MSTNISPEDIARFQTFLSQLSASTSQPMQTPSTEPSSSSPISNSLFGTPGLQLYIFKFNLQQFQDLHHLLSQHHRPRLKQEFLLLPNSTIQIDKDILSLNQAHSHNLQGFTLLLEPD